MQFNVYCVQERLLLARRIWQGGIGDESEVYTLKKACDRYGMPDRPMRRSGYAQ